MKDVGFEGWAIVELFGHNMIAGFASRESIGGTEFIRVDVPDESAENGVGFTKFFNGSAIYAITPTTEAVARVAARRLELRPISPWVVPLDDTPRELPEPDEDAW